MQNGDGLNQEGDSVLDINLLQLKQETCILYLLGLELELD